MKTRFAGPVFPSVTLGSSMASEGWTVHAAGRILREPPDILLQQAPLVLPARAADFTGADHDELTKAVGLDYGPAFRALDAVWLLPDPRIVDSTTFQMIVEKTKAAKKPFVAYSENFVKAGALFSVSPDYNATGQQLVLLSKKMLSKDSVRPEQPYLSKFHYPIGSYSVLNLRTAEAIGLNLSQTQLGFVNRIVNGNNR